MLIKEELLTMMTRADILMQEISDAAEECTATQVPAQNVVSALTAVHEFNKLLNEFVGAHSKDGTFIV